MLRDVTTWLKPSCSDNAIAPIRKLSHAKFRRNRWQGLLKPYRNMKEGRDRLHRTVPAHIFLVPVFL